MQIFPGIVGTLFQEINQGKIFFQQTLHNYINFESIENSKLKSIDKFKKESDIELASIILRPLIDLYLDLRSLEIGVKKGYNLEYLSDLSINYYNFENYRSILHNSKEFYDCEPLYYLKYTEKLKKDFETARNELHGNGVPLFYKINEKYRVVIEDDTKYERVILGKDFYNLYSFLSKRVHFSTTSFFYIRQC